MSKNKRAPRELPGYLVRAKEKRTDALRETFHYARTQRELQVWVDAFKPDAKFDLYKISYDHYGEMKRKVRK